MKYTFSNITYKINKVVSSCTSAKQLPMAYDYCLLYIRRYGDNDMSELYSFLLKTLISKRLYFQLWQES